MKLLLFWVPLALLPLLLASVSPPSTPTSVGVLPEAPPWPRGRAGGCDDHTAHPTPASVGVLPEAPPWPRGRVGGCDDHTTHPTGTPAAFDPWAYVPTDQSPILKVRLVFHVIQDDTGGSHWPNNPQNLGYIRAVVDSLNLLAQTLEPLWYKQPPCKLAPDTTTRHQADSRIRFVLLPQDIYFYQSNYYNRFEVNGVKYRRFLDSVMTPTPAGAVRAAHLPAPGLRQQAFHVVFANQWDKNKQNHQLAGFAEGVAYGSFIVLQNTQTSFNGWCPPAWRRGATRIALHELGHLMGLQHTFMHDGIADTPGTQQGNWDETDCNNIMDYPSSFGSNFTLLQLATMRYHLQHTPAILQAVIGPEVAAPKRPR